MINYGHRVGDLLLVALAKRLRSVISDSSILARLGGDEFAVLAVTNSGQAGDFDLADALLSEIRKPFRIEANEIQIDASLGISS